MIMTFLEYNCRRNTIELLKEFKISLRDEQILYENSLNILNEGLWDSTKNALGKAGKFIKKTIDIPENISAGIFKAYKVMKSVAFLAALVYLGFRFDAIRALFPWLAPVIDQMGNAVLSAGEDFLKASYNWLLKIAKNVALWLGGKALKTVGEALPIPPKLGPFDNPYKFDFP